MGLQKEYENKVAATDLVILGVEDIMKIYNMGRDETYFYLNKKGCPVLPRKRHAPYKVIKAEFEKWLCSQRR